jgi:hypothetical protein
MVDQVMNANQAVRTQATLSRRARYREIATLLQVCFLGPPIICGTRNEKTSYSCRHNIIRH